MLSFVDNWKETAKKAWSLRFMAVAAVLEVASIFLPLYIDSLPRVYFAIVSLAVIMGAMVARLVAQNNLQVTVNNDRA